MSECRPNGKVTTPCKNLHFRHRRNERPGGMLVCWAASGTLMIVGRWQDGGVRAMAPPENPLFAGLDKSFLTTSRHQMNRPGQRGEQGHSPSITACLIIHRRSHRRSSAQYRQPLTPLHLRQRIEVQWDTDFFQGPNRDPVLAALQNPVNPSHPQSPPGVNE